MVRRDPKLPVNSRPEVQEAVTSHAPLSGPDTRILSRELADYYKGAVHTGNFLDQVNTLSVEISGHKNEIRYTF